MVARVENTVEIEVPNWLARRLSASAERSTTVTFALNNVTLPFTLALADKGWKQALIQDAHLREGLNVCEGKVTCEPVAEAHGLPYVSAESVLGI